MEHISGCMKEKKVIGNGQHGFNKNKPYLMKPVVFCDNMAGFVDKEKAVDVIWGEFKED